MLKFMTEAMKEKVKHGKQPFPGQMHSLLEHSRFAAATFVLE